MYLFMEPKQKTTLDLSRAPLLLLASFCQSPVTSRRSGRPTDCRRLEGRVVVFCIVKLTGSLSLTVLSYKTNILKLPLSFSIRSKLKTQKEKVYMQLSLEEFLQIGMFFDLISPFKCANYG